MLHLILLTIGAAAITSPSKQDTIPDNTQPYGTNPIKVTNVEHLGIQLTNSCTHRDLGFVGQVARGWYAVYGDTLWCQPGVTDPADDGSGFHGMVRDSVGTCTDSALMVNFTQLNGDTPIAHPRQFVPYNTSWGEKRNTGFGGTSLCAVDDTSSLLFYLVNQNSDGLVGAGIAQVRIQNGSPTVIKRYGDNGWWWNATDSARYGDVAAYRDGNSQYIYGWGGAPSTITDYTQSQYVYQIRVHASGAWDQSQYEYWWGREVGWQQNVPLTTFNSETAVMWGVGQGSAYYSPYYSCYVYIHLNGNDVSLRTAPAPDGPWSSDISVFTATPRKSDSYVYAPGVHSYLDTSWETLTVSFTNDNQIEVIKITFA